MHRDLRGMLINPPLCSLLHSHLLKSQGASKGRKEYAELQSKLNSLLEDLGQYLDGPVGLTMTTSMKNLIM